MDPIRNPYTPGAGTQPYELAGRDVVREKVRVAIERIKIGRSARGLMLVGLRGVGKTVLLDRMRRDAEQDGAYSVRIEAPESRSLPALLAPALRTVLIRMSRTEHAKEYAERALRALAGFARGLKVKYADIEVGIDFEPEAGLADNGNLSLDLGVLLEQVGIAGKKAKTAVVIFIDELQYVPDDQLSALITAMHRCSQEQLPILLVAAGLPRLRALAGEAKSYSERLFEYPVVGPLDESAARDAIVKPARDEGVEYEHEAVAKLIEQTHGYPYFLQEWGKHAWDVANQSPITLLDVQAATPQTIATLDESFFRVRFDRLTPKEKIYLRAMAQMGAGPHRSGDIASNLGKKVSALAPVRKSLIDKGMVWAPSHGDTAFTVPLFDQFMIRTMTFQEWIDA